MIMKFYAASAASFLSPDLSVIQEDQDKDPDAASDT
jgi:hypothetical protein